MQEPKYKLILLELMALDFNNRDMQTPEKIINELQKQIYTEPKE